MAFQSFKTIEKQAMCRVFWGHYYKMSTFLNVKNKIRRYMPNNPHISEDVLRSRVLQRLFQGARSLAV